MTISIIVAAAENGVIGKQGNLQARERLLHCKRVQQIRCNSWADGYSPDERERAARR